MQEQPVLDGRPRGEILWVFLKLGLTSFGGPVAHLGYFRNELIARRRWLSDSAYADLVALCQFLPGPSSSQVGFALGLIRGGYLGALAAWAAFTMPSVLLLLLFAYGATELGGPIGTGVVHGLKLVACAVVAQAVWGMGRTLCPDLQRLGIAILSALLVTLLPTAIAQVGAVALGILCGMVLCRNLGIKASGSLAGKISKRSARAAIIAFGALFLLLPMLATGFQIQGLVLFETFYRAGALVFGGGHVVLLLLEANVVDTGWLSMDQFLAGYGAAQAVPGPLFSFAAYLGAVVSPEPNGLVGAAIALVAIYLPGVLLVIGLLPYWDDVRRIPTAQAAVAGANAAVVGILAAALYDPIWTSAVKTLPDIGFVVLAFGLLVWGRLAPWALVLLAALAGGGISALGLG